MPSRNLIKDSRVLEHLASFLTHLIGTSIKLCDEMDSVYDLKVWMMTGDGKVSKV